MNVNRRGLYSALFLTSALMVLVSCNIEQSMVLSEDLSGSLRISGESMEFAALAFDDLAILGGFDGASSLYDDAMEQTRSEMEEREDISGFSVRKTSEGSWSADAEFSSLELLLGSTEAGGIVNYSNNGGISTLSMLFDRETAMQYGELIPLFENPAFALFDPGQTRGLDEESYIQDILGFSFGPENIPEIRRAMVRMQLEIPGTVTGVTGGRKLSDDTVLFEMSLSRMLVPDPPVTWAVSWR